MKWYYWALIAGVVLFAIYYFGFRNKTSTSTNLVASAENAAQNAGFNPYYIKEIPIS